MPLRARGITPAGSATILLSRETASKRIKLPFLYPSLTEQRRRYGVPNWVGTRGPSPSSGEAFDDRLLEHEHLPTAKLVKPLGEDETELDVDIGEAALRKPARPKKGDAFRVAFTAVSRGDKENEAEAAKKAAAAGELRFNAQGLKHWHEQYTPLDDKKKLAPRPPGLVALAAKGKKRMYTDPLSTTTIGGVQIPEKSVMRSQNKSSKERKGTGPLNKPSTQDFGRYKLKKLEEDEQEESLLSDLYTEIHHYPLKQITRMGQPMGQTLWRMPLAARIDPEPTPEEPKPSPFYWNGSVGGERADIKAESVTAEQVSPGRSFGGFTLTPKSPPLRYELSMEAVDADPNGVFYFEKRPWIPTKAPPVIRANTEYDDGVHHMTNMDEPISLQELARRSQARAEKLRIEAAVKAGSNLARVFPPMKVRDEAPDDKQARERHIDAAHERSNGASVDTEKETAVEAHESLPRADPPIKVRYEDPDDKFVRERDIRVVNAHELPSGANVGIGGGTSVDNPENSIPEWLVKFIADDPENRGNQKEVKNKTNSIKTGLPKELRLAEYAKKFEKVKITRYTPMNDLPELITPSAVVQRSEDGEGKKVNIWKYDGTTSDKGPPEDIFLHHRENGDPIRQPDQLRIYNEDGTKSVVSYNLSQSNDTNRFLSLRLGGATPKVDVSSAPKTWEEGRIAREANYESLNEKYGIPPEEYREEEWDGEGRYGGKVEVHKVVYEPGGRLKVKRQLPKEVNNTPLEHKQIRDINKDGSRGLIAYIQRPSKESSRNLIGYIRGRERTDGGGFAFPWSLPEFNAESKPMAPNPELKADTEAVEFQTPVEPIEDHEPEESTENSGPRIILMDEGAELRNEAKMVRRVTDFIVKSRRKNFGEIRLPIDGGEVLAAEADGGGGFLITLPSGSEYLIDPETDMTPILLEGGKHLASRGSQPGRTADERIAWKVAITTANAAPPGFGKVVLPTDDGPVEIVEETAGRKYRITVPSGTCFVVDTQKSEVITQAPYARAVESNERPLERYVEAEGEPLPAHTSRNPDGNVARHLMASPQKEGAGGDEALRYVKSDAPLPPRGEEGVSGEEALRFVEDGRKKGVQRPIFAPNGKVIKDKHRGLLHGAYSSSVRDKLKEDRQKEQQKRLDAQIRLLDSVLEDPKAAPLSPPSKSRSVLPPSKSHNLLPSSQQLLAPSLPLKFLDFFNLKKPRRTNKSFSTMASQQQKASGVGYKLVFTCPEENLSEVKEAVFKTGAGVYPGEKYAKVSFDIPGKGQFIPIGDAKPAVGEVGEMEFVEEIRCEIFCISKAVAREAVKALIKTHPYEQVAYEVYEMVDILADDGTVD